MRSIPQAMIWELLHRGRWPLLAALLGANILPMLLFTAMRLEGEIDHNEHSMIIMHMLLVQLNMFMFATGVFFAQGHPSRLYTAPVPTVTLVVWQLLPAMAAVALELLVSTAVLNALFGLGWPLWGPAMFSAVAASAVAAVLWLTEKSAWLPLALAVVAAALGFWNKSRYGLPFSQPTRYWMEVTPAEVLAMLAFAAVSFYVAVVAVGRNRRGEPLPSLGIVAWLERTFDLAPVVSRRFRTPAQAQFWFECRKKGWAMPVTVIAAIIVCLCIWTIVSRDPHDLFIGLVRGGGLLVVVGLIGGLIMGNSGSSDADFEIGQFLGTRPMTNSELARTTLKATGASVLLAWLIWAAALMLLIALLRTTGRGVPELPDGLGWWYLPVTLLGPWTVAAVIGSVILAGRTRLFVQLSGGAFALLVAWSLASKFPISDEAQMTIVRGAATTIGLGLILGSGWMFFDARRRSLVGWPTVYVAFTLWAALAGLMFLDPVLRLFTSAYVFLVGLLALAVVPLAAAPLAMAWNRNR